MTTSTNDLSPAAQAVRDAALATYDRSIPKDDSLWALDRASVAAALRAAADQVVPEPDDAAKETFSIAALRHRWQIRDQFLAIAAELESQ
jgi:hypothetical protein